jgi:glycosyltransferase involved in cell wall biosynthesis
MLRDIAHEADIVFQNNISLQTLFPLLFLGKPIVISHHTWLTRTNGRRNWQDYLKLAVLPVCHNVSISKAIAASLPVKSVVVGNPFETREFAGLQDSPRTRDIVFLGRLVSDKGCDLALRALSLLKAEEFRPSFSIIGDGSELPALQRLTTDLGLSEQVAFLGSIREGRGREIARHTIMVIPSRWAEPFGVVVLEGLAAGCVIVASSAGGLPEAVGSCGALYPNGDITALASTLKDLLKNPSLRQELMRGREAHLKQFQPEVVARKYLEVFQTALQS